jgi:hypothetical protein
MLKTYIFGQEDISPSGIISGKVVLSLTRQQYLRGIWVKLSVISTVKDPKSTSSLTTTASFNHLSNEEDFMNDGIYDVRICLQ